MDFNIAALSSAAASADVQNAFSVGMLSKSLDSFETLGENMVKIIDASAMEHSVNPHIGGNIDISI